MIAYLNKSATEYLDGGNVEDFAASVRAAACNTESLEFIAKAIIHECERHVSIQSATISYRD